MKSLMLKLTALLMVCTYITGIAGLDVHSCRASGKDYVVAAISGMTGLECEDIHPESHGHHCLHGHHDHHCLHYLPHDNDNHEKVDNNHCCSNTYHPLTLSGSADSQPLHVNYFPSPVSGHLHCCRCCEDCHNASTGMLSGRGLLDGVPFAGYDFRGKLFSVFRI